MKLDTIVHGLEGRAVILENQLASQHAFFTNELKNKDHQIKAANELTQHAENITDSYKRENADLLKQITWHKVKEWILAGLLIVVVGLSL